MDSAEGTHTIMVNKSTTKEVQIYNGEKTSSSISGAGKLETYR